MVYSWISFGFQSSTHPTWSRRTPPPHHSAGRRESPGRDVDSSTDVPPGVKPEKGEANVHIERE